MPDPPLKPPPGPPLPPVTDGELLMRYSLHGETAALEEVIERHRAMIWGVCTRVLARRADAEDAYQATLLILARKAGSVRANDSAAGWLFRVAHNAAIAARRRRLRRRETPLEESPPAPEEALPDLARQEVVAALLEELRSLPTKYQTALALRYLEGRSRREIAAALDATVATVAGQLVRGRRLLRTRLVRRGVSLGVALGAFGAAGTTHAAALVHARPPAVDLSSLLTGSSSAASAGVHTLVSQGIRSMFYASVTKPAAVGAAVVVAAAALLVDPPEGIARSGEGAPRLNATMVTTNEEGGTSGPVRITDPGGGGAPDREAPERDEPGTQDAGASPAESAPATADQPADDDPVAEALQAFLQKAKARKTGDLSQPSFEELYWQYTHWQAELKRYDTAVGFFESRAEAARADYERKKTLHDENLVSVNKLETAKNVLNGTRSELQAARAKLPLARAKVAEFERLLMQAALRETALKSLAAAIGEAPEREQPATPSPVASPAEDARLAGTFIEDKSSVSNALEQFDLREAPDKVNATFVPGPVSPEEQRKMFDNLKKHYAEQVAAEDRDLSQTSFEEYYWQVAHWRSKQEALKFRLDVLNQQAGDLSKAVESGTVPRDELIRLSNEQTSEMQTVGAELSLARANLIKYERLMKQAAVRETGAKPVTEQSSTVLPPDPLHLIRRLFEKRDRKAASSLRSAKELKLEFQRWQVEEAAHSARMEAAEQEIAAGVAGEIRGVDKTKIKADVLNSRAKMLEARVKQAELKRLIEQAQAREKQASADSPEPVVTPTTFGGPPQPFVSPLVRESDSALKVGPFEVSSKLLAPGDVVLVDCTLSEDVVHVNKRCVVEADGTIGLGAAIGRVKVSGLTMRQAEKAVQEHLDKEWEATVQLTPAQVPIPTSLSANPSPYRVAPPRLAAPPTTLDDLKRAHSEALPFLLTAGSVVLIDSTLTGPDRDRLKKRAVVQADGSLALGALIGRVNVAGLTLREAEEVVQSRFDEFWNEEKVQLTQATPSSSLGIIPPRAVDFAGPQNPTPRSMLIKPGETLFIEVYDRFDETHLYHGSARVDGTGQIALGAAWGRVEAVGKTLEELEKAIANRIRQMVSDDEELREKLAASEGKEFTQRPVIFSVQVQRTQSTQPILTAAPYPPAPPAPAATPHSRPILVGDYFTYAITDQSNGGRVYNGAGMVSEEGVLNLQLNPGLGGEDPSDNWVVAKIAGLDVAAAEATIMGTLRDKFDAKEVEVRLWRVGPVDQPSSAPLRIYPGVDGPQSLAPPRVYPGVDPPQPEVRY